jgi:hypothetical protein
VRVDPVTGAVSIVAEVPGGYVVPRDATAFDPWRRRYLGVAYTGEYPAVIRRLLAVDTRTGAVALGPALDQEVFGVEYDPGAGALYGLQNTGYYGTGFRLLRLDTATGASTVVATVSGYSVTPMVTAYDPEGHRYTAIGDTGEYPNVTHRLFTFDTQRGAVTAGPALDRQPVNVRTDAPVPVPRLFMPFVPKAAA